MEYSPVACMRQSSRCCRSERGPTLPHGRAQPARAIVIYWNTAHLGKAVRQRKHAGLTVEPEFLAHISPLGWAHILLTGEYRWPKRR